MKKTFFLLLALLTVAVVSCEESTVDTLTETPSLSVSPESLEFPCTGGELTLTVDCSVTDWTVQSNKDWCDAVKTNSETITLSASALSEGDTTPDIATITIMAGDGEYVAEVTVMVSQQKYLIDLSFAIEISNIGYTGADYSIVPSDDTHPYCVVAMPTLLYGDYTDAQLIDAVVKAGVDTTYFGAQELKFSELEYPLDYPDSEYKLVVFGYEDGEYTSNAATEMYTTLASTEDPNACEFTFGAPYVFSTNAIISIETTDPYMLYLLNFVPMSDIDLLTTETYEEYIETYFDLFYSITWYGDRGLILSPTLVPSTDYAVVTVPVDGRGNIIGDIKIAENVFTTEYAEVASTYDSWLGTWTVTSTSTVRAKKSITFDMVVREKVSGESYSVYGFECSENRWIYPITANYVESYLSSKGSIQFPNYTDLGVLDEGWTSGHYAVYNLSNSYTLIEGDWNALSGVVSDDGQSATIACATGTYGDADFIACGIVLLALEEGTTSGFWEYTADASLGVKDGDTFIGPYNLVKKSDGVDLSSPAAAAAMARLPKKSENTGIYFKAPYAEAQIKYVATPSYELTPYKIQTR
ncbi:MAG: BACON domain-containing protein [Rikenellaceae bacterium]